MNRLSYRSMLIGVGLAAIVGLAAATGEYESSAENPAPQKNKPFGMLMNHVNNIRGQAGTWGKLGFDMGKHYIGQAHKAYSERMAKKGAKPEGAHAHETSSRGLESELEKEGEHIVKEEVKEAVEPVKEAADHVEDAAEEASDKVEDVVENAEEIVDNPVEAAAEKVAEEATEVANDEKKDD